MFGDPFATPHRPAFKPAQTLVNYSSLPTTKLEKKQKSRFMATLHPTFTIVTQIQFAKTKYIPTTLHLLTAQENWCRAVRAPSNRGFKAVACVGPGSVIRNGSINPRTRTPSFFYLPRFFPFLNYVADFPP